MWVWLDMWYQLVRRPWATVSVFNCFVVNAPLKNTLYFLCNAELKRFCKYFVLDNKYPKSKNKIRITKSNAWFCNNLNDGSILRIQFPFKQEYSFCRVTNR